MKSGRSFPALLAIALAVSGVALAASIHVMPTTITLGPGKATGVLTITNEGEDPINAQVRVFAWDQAGGKDSLNATQKVVVSPPMTALAPKQTQSIRVVRVDKTDATAEEAYRLVIDEIVDPAKAPKTGVAVQMRYSVPVFVLPKATMPSGTVNVTAQATGSALSLKAHNPSEAHVQLADVSVEHQGGAITPVQPGLLGYVLSGGTMQWTLAVPSNAAAGGRPVRVHANVNGQPLNVDL
ncbi:fimbrial biogenesis chaperone [Lysobacter auxotrophicus]|uniref:Molecular chaperone n=1 Tax=Lysobacter auxotrophicus TaxID=2992573 RepID=A0ABN6UIW5_9GAMM|nr:molecular chaperone [Lysobacter auxotrophicus]BDU16233.1 molecular chaperone [Lysobacter auxotrophicus]